MRRDGLTDERWVYPGIGIAFFLWYIIFILMPFNFWVMMSISTSLLASIAFSFGRPLFRENEFHWQSVLWGVGLSVILYALFWIGNHALIFMAHTLPGILDNRVANINAVYANRGALSPVLVGMLLFFPIGFGEEIFWRGFIQRHFMMRWGGRKAFLLTTLLYTAIHLPTGNPVLLLAALTGGVFWGGIYWATGRLVPVLVSHMLWDPAIFVIWPMR